MADSSVINNSVKVLGEAYFLPGSSQLLDGDIKGGAAYAVLGIATKAVIGGPAMALVAADSFSRSVSGKGLIGHLKDKLPAKKVKAPTPVEATTEPATAP